MGVFCVVNVLGTGVFPIPIGAGMMVLAGILYGLWLGLALYLSTSLLGAWLTFGITRLLHSRIITMLGRHATTSIKNHDLI